MAMRVLVIGGTGMLGEPVARSLAAAGHSVRVLSRHPERAAERFAGLCELVRGDVEDRDSLARAFEGYRKLRAPDAKLRHMPFWLAQIMGLMPGGRELRTVALPLMQYFSRVPEAGDPAEANAMLGAPSTTLEVWCRELAAPHSEKPVVPPLQPRASEDAEMRIHN